MEPTDKDFDWMVARAKDLIEKGMDRERALDLAMRDGQEKARTRRTAEPSKPVVRKPLTVPLGEAAKVSFLRQRRA